MKIITGKILAILAQTGVPLTEKQVVEALIALGINNEILIKRTLTTLANNRRIKRYETQFKNFTYALPSTQRRIDTYFK